MSDSSYSSESIKVCKGLEGVRLRPDMYIGDTDDGTGLHHMVFEVSDNAFDEVAEYGPCDTVKCQIHEDGSVSIEDNGRGIPVDLHKEEGVSAAEVIMTNLHAGGKFDQETYKMSGGLHGLGVSVVNALSTWLDLTIYRDKKEHFIRFEEGVPVSPLKLVCDNIRKRGTIVRFMPSSDVFSSIEFDFSILEQRFRELSFLNSKVKINLSDRRPSKKKEITFFSDSGIKDFVKYLDRNKSSLINAPVSFKSSSQDGEMIIDIALQWNESYYENTLCFTNNVKQRDGGAHLSGFRSALTRAINNYIVNQSASKKSKINPTSDDIREGLTCVLSLKMSEPKFASQTKDKLVSSNARAFVEGAVFDNISSWLEENPKIAKIILDKIIAAALSREAAKAARDITRKKGNIELASLSGKLTPCRSKSPKESEVLILEGQSAAGTAKQGRDSRYQAVLPLRGKILNVERVRFDKVLASSEIACLITALGAGIGESEFDIEKIRYHKIIIMTDADVDGAHIRSLLLTFFFRYMREVIERGYLYVAQPPLYRLVKRNKEFYLKDEKSLSDYFWNSVTQDAELNLSDGSTVSGSALLLVIDKCKIVSNCSANLISDVPQIFIELFYYKNDILDRLQCYDNAKYSVLDRDDDFVIVSEVAGVAKYYKIPKGNDYSEMIDALSVLDHIFSSVVTLKIKNNSYSIISPTHLLDIMSEDSKKGVVLQRFKGLGEMNAQQLWKTTLDPKNRTLMQLSVDDAEAADEMFSILMGSVVAPRRKFIVDNALTTHDIDI